MAWRRPERASIRPDNPSRRPPTWVCSAPFASSPSIRAANLPMSAWVTAGGRYVEAVLAQELERIRPDAVHTRRDGLKLVDYAKVA